MPSSPIRIPFVSNKVSKSRILQQYTKGDILGSIQGKFEGSNTAIYDYILLKQIHVKLPSIVPFGNAARPSSTCGTSPRPIDTKTNGELLEPPGEVNFLIVHRRHNKRGATRNQALFKHTYSYRQRLHYVRTPKKELPKSESD